MNRCLVADGEKIIFIIKLLEIIIKNKLIISGIKNATIEDGCKNLLDHAVGHVNNIDPLVIVLVIIIFLLLLAICFYRWRVY